ncbi:SDR family NAD(P)-dependent oxidoreductase [Streptomyces sp. NPDC057757]|uniref:SDR family NAD(P)-dependent oxidoreductase n=1 Tax=Streptomyces sp. NPDC057757 TaxID=3346241 RepID=UPI0036857C5C
MNTPASVALVAGGASGLGFAVAAQLIRRGDHVVLLDLPFSRGVEAAEQLGPRAEFVAADVTEPLEVEAAVEAATELGNLRTAVSCAGVATPGRVLGRGGVLPLEQFAHVVAVNLIGTFNVLRVAAAAMSANAPDSSGDRGVIVCTSSIAAFDGQVGQVAYAASKGGVAALTLSAARDLAEHAIRVVTIAPGVFDTPLLAALPAGARASLGATVPHPSRLGLPEEFAALVAHVLENPMLNGEVIRLDGALRMAPR